MADININKFRTSVVREGSRPASAGFVESEGQDPVDPAGSTQNHLPVTIGSPANGLAVTDAQVLTIDKAQIFAGTASQFVKGDGTLDSTAYGTGSVTSVALTMPSAFSVANSPITTAGTIAVTGAGTVAQYVRGDGSLADFPESSGGGSSVSYYLNGSVSQGTIGGVAYLEMNKVPILGAGTDFTRNSNGYIASFITDAGDPNLLEIPAGNWNFESFFSASSGGGSPTFYVELYKVNSSGTATLIASNSANPELISFGTTIAPYFSSLAVPTTVLALTDRLAVRYYVTPVGRTLTLHTEGPHLCQIITTFTTGLTALNGLTAQVQFFAVGTSGTDFNIASATATHTFNLPTASGTNRGALSSSDWTTFNNKENAITAGTTAQYYRGDKTFQTLNTSVVPELTNLYYTEARVSANTDVAANTAARHNAVTLGTANGLSLSTQQLSLQLASGSQNGALSSTDWTTFNSKENAITAGTTAQYFRGDKTFQTLNTGVVPESGNLYFTNARAIASVLTGYTSGAGTISAADSILSAIQKLNGNIGSLVTGVSSVNGQTGVVVLTTTNIAEGTNLYYTEARVNANTNVAANTAARHNAVTLGTANGLSLSTQQLSLGLASAGVTGALSGTDWSTFNSKQNTLTLTTTGTSGAATLVGSTLNIPNYTETDTLQSVILRNGTTNTGFTISNNNNSYTDPSNTNVPFIYMYNTGTTSTSNSVLALRTNSPTGGDPILSFDIGGVIGWSMGIDNSDSDKFKIANNWAALDSNTRFSMLTTGEATFTSSVTASSIIKSGGTSSQFLKADGSVDSNTYVTGGPFLPLTGGTLTNTGGNVTPILSFASSSTDIFQWITGAFNANMGVGNTMVHFIGQSGNTKNSGYLGFNYAGDQSDSNFLSLGFFNNDNLLRLYGNGNLGVGVTSNAGFKLDVNGTGRFSGNLRTETSSVDIVENKVLNTNIPNGNKYITMFAGGTTAFGVASWVNSGVIESAAGTGSNLVLSNYENGPILFQTNNRNTKLTLTGSGNLGLGVTPSAWFSGSVAFQLGATGSVSARTGTTETIAITSNAILNPSGSWQYIISASAALYETFDGQHIWRTAPSGTAGNAISFTQAMTLGSNSGLSIGTPSAAPAQGLLVQGNVGIGVGPVLKLDVQGNAADTTTVSGVTVEQVTLFRPSNGVGGIRSGFNTSTGDAYLWSAQSSGNLYLGTRVAPNNNVNVAILSSGNVGIGTASPAAELQVGKTSDVTIAMSNSSSVTSGNRGSLSWYNSSVSTVALIRASAITDNVGTELQFYTRPAAGSLTQAMTITSGGNVGIGETNPQSKLIVSGASLNNEGLVNINNTKSAGGVYFPALKVRNVEGNHSFGIVSEFSTGSTGGDRPSVLFYTSASNHSWTIGQVTSAWGIADSFGIGYRANNSPSTFTGWPTNYFAITTGGNVLIGTTTDNGSRLQVNGTSQFRSNIQVNDGTAGTSPKIAFGTEDPSVQGHKSIYLESYWMYMQVHYNEGFRIRAVNGVGGSQTIATFAGASGNLTTLGSITATSFFESSDSKIKTLLDNNVDYSLIANVGARYYEKNGVEELGYFAQDFEQILPSAVYKDDKGLLNLSYTQVHTAKIAALEKRITELESQLKNN
jgi:hypothetical protein